MRRRHAIRGHAAWMPSKFASRWTLINIHTRVGPPVFRDNARLAVGNGANGKSRNAGSGNRGPNPTSHWVTVPEPIFPAGGVVARSFSPTTHGSPALSARKINLSASAYINQGCPRPCRWGGGIAGVYFWISNFGECLAERSGRGTLRRSSVALEAARRAGVGTQLLFDPDGSESLPDEPGVARIRTLPEAIAWLD